MVYWNHDASIERTHKAVSRDARHAIKKGPAAQRAAKTPRRKRLKGVPKRGRLMRQVLQVPTSRSVKGMRAFVGALLFGLIGGAIALFSAGMPLKGKPSSENSSSIGIAMIVTICLFILGGIVGWFVGAKKPVPEESKKEDTEVKQNGAL